jgi:hypothetical protein
MGWDLGWFWLLPMDWYIPGVGGERMTGWYTELGQLAVVVRVGRPLG